MTRASITIKPGNPHDKWVNFLRVAFETIPPHQRRAAIDGLWKIAKQSRGAGADRSGSATGSGSPRTQGD